VEENRELLKDRINEAKLVGEKANQSRSVLALGYGTGNFCRDPLVLIYFHLSILLRCYRNTITYLKNSIEAIRKDR